MADNITVDTITGSPAVATDDVASVHYQRVKLDIGGDGATSPITSSNPLPVTSTGAAAENAAASGNPVLTAGRYDATPRTLGDGDAGAIALNASGQALIELASGGVAGKAEDAAHVSGDEGVLVLAVRRDSAAVGSGTDGDYSTINVNASGRVYTSATIDAALPTGTNNIGDVDVATVPTDPFGANADAASATGSISAKLRFIASTGIPITGTVTVGSHAVTNAGTFAVQAGQAAHDAAISGNPVRLAGRALTASYTAVATGDTADLVTTTIGQLVTIPYSIPENTWSYAAASGGITNTTGVTAVAAAGAGLRRYITRCQIINGHATVSTDVQIRDGAAGTVLWRGFAQAAGGGAAAVFDPPLRGTANTLVEVACGTTGSATYFNLQGYTAP